MSLIITALRIESERLWNRVAAALQERRSGFNDYAAGDFLDAEAMRADIDTDEPHGLSVQRIHLTSVASPPGATERPAPPTPDSGGAGHPNVLPALLSNAALAVELWLGGDRPSNPATWRRLAEDLHSASLDLRNP